MKNLFCDSYSDISRHYALTRYIYYCFVFILALIFSVQRGIMFQIPLLTFYIATYLVGFYACKHIHITLEKTVLRVGFLYVIMNMLCNILLLTHMMNRCSLLFIVIEIDNCIWLCSRYSRINYLIKEGSKIGRK